MRRTIGRGAALILSLSLLGAACGDDDDGGSSASTTAGGGDTGATTTAGGSGGGDSGRAASGEPIRLGFVNQEGDPAGDYSDFHAGVDVAIAYINEELGGIDGRPLELEFCETRTASGGDVCANEMVQAGVPMVIGGYNTHTGPMLPILQSAGVPLVSAAALSSGDFPSDDNHWAIMISTITGYVATGQYINSLDPERVSIIHIDAPPPLQASQILAGVVEPSGATVELFALPADAPDVTPVVSAAGADDPDVIMLAMAPPACGKVMAAVAQLGLGAQVITPPGCINLESLQSAGSGAAGTQFFSPLEPVISAEPSEEMQAYFDALEAYGSGEPTQRGAEGFAMIMTVKSILEAAGGADATADSILEFMRGASQVEVYMGVPFTCTPPPLDQAPAVCADGVQIWEVTDDLRAVAAADGYFTAGG